MKIIIRYNNQNHLIEIDQEGNLQDLLDLLSDSIIIPNGTAKFVVKGKQLSNLSESLIQHNIIDGSKLLLVVTEALPEKPAIPVRRIRQTQFPPSLEFLTSAPHAPIIAKGPPLGVEKPYKGHITILPKTPFIVYNTEGIISSLSIESDAFWIQPEDGKNERIFYNDINNILVQDIPKYEEQYVAIALHTNIGKRWFYFIPHQYSQVLKSIVK